MKVKENQASHIFGSYLEHNLESGDFYYYFILKFQHLAINKHSPSKINLTFDKHFPGKKKRYPISFFCQVAISSFQNDQNLGIFSCQIYKLKKINPNYVS
jgi:hypothetical protein